jgi:diguanylate cyclase (GGDEF)-like protein
MARQTSPDFCIFYRKTQIKRLFPVFGIHFTRVANPRVVSNIPIIKRDAGGHLNSGSRVQLEPELVSGSGPYRDRRNPLMRVRVLLRAGQDPLEESGDTARDRLFLQVLLVLAVNIMALAAIVYLLLPLSEQGRATSGALLWGVGGITACIAALFITTNWRVLCANLLLLGFSSILIYATFFLGGVMSPTMIFLMVMPVLAVTLMGTRWAYVWTALKVGAWLVILVLESTGVQMARITLEGNVGMAHAIALLGTALVVMSVLRSYDTSNRRLRRTMEEKAERLDFLASHDPLTGIPNRRAFFDQAHKSLRAAARTRRPFALLVIDLNDFKQINDRHGHKVGDAVLKHFARRLRAGFRETDFIARLGGDEFAIILEPVSTVEGVERVLERFAAMGDNEVDVEGTTVPYRYAVGSALYPDQGRDIVGLFEWADSAMYHTKRAAPAELLWK